MNRLSIPIDHITIKDRQRLDLGDLDSLAQSLSRYGLIQPIVIDQNNRLIAGERRLRAAQMIGWESIDVVYRETLSEDELKELELEENVRRKEMTWQERCLAIADIHKIKTQTAALTATTWGYRETAELLGLNTTSSVHYATSVAKALLTGDKEVTACDSMMEALRVLLRRKEDEANRLILERVQSTVPQMAGVVESPELPSTNLTPGEPYPVYLSNMLHHGEAMDVLSRRFAPGTVSYIVTDPPYAIDMSNLSQENTGMADIERVAEEHDVESNLALLSRFVPLAYHILRDPGWMVLWCDMWNWRWLADECAKAGFRVQRWPLTWVKTHRCMNQQAMKNWTKSTEVALVASKGSATLLTPQPVSHYACSNDDKSNHPFGKPIDLWTWIYSAIVMKGMAVLDPFAGTGSACIAAIRYGSAPLAVESNDKHYAMLVQNVQAEYQRLVPNVLFK